MRAIGKRRACFDRHFRLYAVQLTMHNSSSVCAGCGSCDRLAFRAQFICWVVLAAIAHSHKHAHTTLATTSSPSRPTTTIPDQPPKQPPNQSPENTGEQAGRPAAQHCKCVGDPHTRQQRRCGCGGVWTSWHSTGLMPSWQGTECWARG